MTMDERIARINELYHKSQEAGLTTEEKEEQARLRQEYIASVKSSLTGQLDNVDIKEKDGSITNLGDKIRQKKENLSNMPSEEIVSKKKEIRKAALENRGNLNKDDILLKSRLITDKLTIDDVYEDASLILLYASYNNEVNTFGIMERAINDGKKVAFPKCGLVDGVPTIEFYEVNSLSKLTDGYMGIPEPDTNKYNLKKVTKMADLCIVPGVAFDKSGNRIGYGKGFYDRFIQRRMASVYAGICFESQIEKNIPCETTDRPVDMVITEENIYVRS